MFKENLKINLLKSAGKPYVQNYKIGTQYGTVNIVQKGLRHLIDCELVDKNGNLVTFLKKECNSFEEMWLEITKIFKFK